MLPELQTLEAFQPLIAFQGNRRVASRLQIYGRPLNAIVAHRIGNRPDRFEPRLKKRRPKAYDRLMMPRHEAKREILKRLGDF